MAEKESVRRNKRTTCATAEKIDCVFYTAKSIRFGGGEILENKIGQDRRTISESSREHGSFRAGGKHVANLKKFSAVILIERLAGWRAGKNVTGLRHRSKKSSRVGLEKIQRVYKIVGQIRQ